MKSQCGPGSRLLLRCTRFRSAAQGAHSTTRPIFRAAHTTTRNFVPDRPQVLAAADWPMPVPTSWRHELGCPRLQAARQRSTRRAALSTGSPRRAAGDEDPKLAGGTKEEGTQRGAGAGGKAAYPERLVIYHAGTGKTTFLACLKVTTLFVFGFFDMIVVPAYLSAGEPLLKTAGVGLCGIIPAVYVAWSTSPFVAAIHLHLPPYARWSRAILERFARTAPASTRVDVTTMSLIGKPRVSSMVLADLRPARRRFGMVNYVRETARADAGRAWWRFRAVAEFNVLDGQERHVKNGWVWREIRDLIARRSGNGTGAGAGRAS